jgi:hypothetical protein
MAMKRNPSLAAVRQRMAPGRLSATGFLGEDERPLDEIVAADLAQLDESGVTPSQIADLLDELHRVADEGLEAPRPACDGRASAEVVESMGRISCPFACGVRSHKAVVHVKAGSIDLYFTPLHAHLIREHGFFQGRGSEFRLEPRDLVALYVACRR